MTMTLTYKKRKKNHNWTT